MIAKEMQQALIQTNMEPTRPTPSRRDLLRVAACAAVAETPVAALALNAMEPTSTFVSLLRAPDLVRAFGPENKEVKLSKTRDGLWEGDGVAVEAKVLADHVSLSLRSPGKVCHVQLRWRGDLTAIKRYLGDHWERSYADLEWRGTVAGRPMPWYFMAFDGKATHGYGVRTHPKAFCFWNADEEGISLWADVRNGGSPVELGSRTLEFAEVVCRPGLKGESPFQATREFCRLMCPQPKLLDHTVYGTNDWNYAYGNNSAELIAGVSGLVSELSPNAENRPYSVIDDGWSIGAEKGHLGYGPWEGNKNFGDMGAFADRLKKLGIRPGLWFRPLTPLPDSPNSWRSEREKSYLDPTLPEVLDHVAKHMKRFAGWGYQMVKHDFTSWDMFGRWGFQMGGSVTRGGWHLHDRTITNAEAILNLYRTIREAAGSVHLIGCNTFSHLATGFHEVQRTGDDTSGVSWNRNRRMGVNTLAFRAAQQGTMYSVDPDIVSITQSIPWEMTEQWMRLVSESGTALFVAMDPSIVEPKHRTALKKALEVASKPQQVGEPLDWLDTDCPRKWKLRGKKVEFAWMGEFGSWPFGD